LNGVIDDIERYLGWLRGSAEPFNNSLPGLARQAVEARKAKVLKDRNSVADLGFQLKQRPDAPKTYVALVVRKPIAQPKPTKSSEPFKPEPKLEDDTYKQILTIMEGMARVMERSPSNCPACGNEDERTIVLTPARGLFYCFDAKVGGDCLALVQHITGLDVKTQPLSYPLPGLLTIPQPPSRRKRPRPKRKPPSTR
jgi:hypothetical protein